ncbi:MAG: single-stranded DNA-binding protein [Muribaculum sp.]|nr:single-stranded DNA-binding protein [Muribaculum sp.]
MNKVLLIGNVGRDPEVRYVDKTPVATFSLATSDTPQPGSTDVPAVTEWHRIFMWGPAAEFAEKYIRKGTRLFVEGRLRTRTWEDRNTIKRSVTEILVDQFEILAPPKS